MTEQEWLECADRQKMLEFLRGKASERKLRLFACGCSRQTWDSLTLESVRGAVQTAEKYADGSAGNQELRATHEKATQSLMTMSFMTP
jgi:hypothetical protein